MTMFKFSIILSALLSTAAFSFPEMIRFGYVSCNSCHMDPQGGSILTAYGRGAAVDMLSTFSVENETHFPIADWIKVGGDVRVAQVKQQTEDFDREQFILMQADFIAGLDFNQIKVIGSLGHQLNSRIHYLMFQPADNLSLRVGKFKLPYGINFPNHIRLVKRSLGLYENVEPYQMEVYGFNDYAEFSVNLGLIEKASTLKIAGFISTTSKLGLSYYPEKAYLGPFAMLSLSDSVTLLSELNYGINDKSVVTTSKLSYQIHKGINVYGVYERDEQKDVYGMGFLFYPRPRFEIEGEYQKISDANGLSDYGFLVGHFYL